jgi:hypothetical protein
MGINKVLSEAARKQIVKDNWPIRRRWMKIWTILFGLNMQAIAVDTIWRGGNNLEIQIFITLASSVVGVLFFYVFGAVWDDHSKRQMGFGQRDYTDSDAADDAAGDAADEAENPPNIGAQNKPSTAG